MIALKRALQIAMPVVITALAALLPEASSSPIPAVDAKALSHPSLSLSSPCDHQSSTDSTIFHTGKEASVLESLAVSNPNDGYLKWITSHSSSSSFDRSIYIPVAAGGTDDQCSGLGFHWSIDSKKGLIHIAFDRVRSSNTTRKLEIHSSHGCQRSQ